MNKKSTNKRLYVIYAIHSFFLYTITFVLCLLLMNGASSLLVDSIKEQVAGMIFAAVFVAPISWFSNIVWIIILLLFFKKSHMIEDYSFVVIMSVGMGALPLTTFIPLALLDSIPV